MRSSATYRHGQDHPPTANEIPSSAAPPAQSPPPNFHSLLPTIKSGSGRNRLYLIRQKLRTHPAAKCLPWKNNAIATASTIRIMATSRPPMKHSSSGALQQQAIAV